MHPTQFFYFSFCPFPIHGDEMDCLDVGIDIPPLVYTSLSHFFDTRRTEQVREFDVQ
ncbi:unnamed protein product [Musa acuminata var. zebrina]